MTKVLKYFYYTCMFLAIHPMMFAQRSDSLVQEAWNAWERNDQHEVEKFFRAALQMDPHSTRAYLGLSYLYTLQEKNDDAWKVFQNALQYVPNMYPYIFSVWLTPKFRHNGNRAEAGIIRLLESLTVDPNAVNFLQAAACDLLGEYYESKKELSKAKRFYDRQNTINEWMLIGPFENISASGYEKIFPPEETYDSIANYEGKNGIPLRWFKIPALRNDYWVDLAYNFSFRNAVYYGNTFVFSPVKQKVWIRVGTSGSLKSFLNDELIFDRFDENNNDVDTYIAETELQEGWNRLLIKCGYSEISQCNFKVRITDPNGYPIPGLKVSVDSQHYSSRPKARVRQIPNFAEEFFKQKIANNSNELENYLLLADCYLRNDKAIEAELVLRKAIQLSPHCSVFQVHLLEAFVRGKKFDERTQTLEKLAQMDPQIPAALTYKIEHNLQNEEYDEAERLIGILAKLQPESENVFRHQIDLYSKKKYTEKFLATVNQASAKYSENWDFVYLKAYIAFQMDRKPSDAIGIIEKYLDGNYTHDALYSLSDFYLQSSDMEGWEKTFKKILELQPAAPGYRYHMVEIYTSEQNLQKAETAISEAIRICPGNTTYWNKRGDILRMKNDRDGACSAYREALRLDQSNRSAREALRELENKGSIYANFEPVDIRALVKGAPPSTVYPNDPAIFLLDDMRRVVYERGASEYVREILVKVFNSRGIDAFKEYDISYNSYNEKLNIDKAVVIKRDGSEIKADINENQVILKTLEPNDVVHLKFRVRKLYGGRLAKHFWDSYHFNCFYPIKLLRYSLLIPEGITFRHSTQNMVDTPQIKKTNDGTLYSWSIVNEPAVESEPNMPPLEEVGKMLHVSSIESWQNIADWYTDIAETKTRTTYEIDEQVKELLKDSSNFTDEQKAESIYNFITEHIRYSSVPFRQSGLIPQKARDVLVNKIGDCKDVATLCIAMLRDVGIKSYYVLINTRNEGTSPKLLPCINFNHCIVAIDVSGGLRFCDLTANYHSFKTLPDNDVGGFYLLIKPNEMSPHYFTTNQFPARNIRRTTTIALRDDNSALIERNSLRYGSASAFYRENFQSKSHKEQEEELISTLTRDYPSVKLDSFVFKGLENKGETAELKYTIKVPQLSSDAGQFKILKAPWTDSFEKWSALSRDSRIYPFQYWTDLDTLSEELTVWIPQGYKVVEAGKKVQISSPIAEYEAYFLVEKGILSGHRQVIFKKDLILPDEYNGFKEFYNKVIIEDSRQILLKKR